MRKQRLMDVLDVINRLAGDDFCEVLDCEAAFSPDELTDKEKICHEKLSEIYKLAHAFSDRHTCYHVHAGWRSRLAVLEAAAREESCSNLQTTSL